MITLYELNSATSEATSEAIRKTIKGGLIASMTMLLIIFIALIVFWIYKKRKNRSLGRGSDFENEVARRIENWSAKQNFFFFGPSIYKYEKNMFEVDGLLLSSRGLIVIEVKSRNGDIEGDYELATWWKINGPSRYEQPNHLRQNDKHIAHFKKILGDKIDMYSFLIYEDFNNQINIKNVPDWAVVFKENEFEEKMTYFKEAVFEKYSEKEIAEIYEKIKKSSTNSVKDRLKFNSYFK
ncbi:nuclease-related domain-containing protein [[Mycoplasma] gypis]|uniref:Nuclease-related domain-containing protein n=1 Tax=[Mycoplasma] gypis TaxID=92404 RepID=A0ABZ2RR83_9BACT|nr:nuclease-related domain-containing protein [[Mycoplasma] gypis]MBN0919153.1 NERD domain-containing protein [[Mycoplasma] gypis]